MYSQFGTLFIQSVSEQAGICEQYVLTALQKRMKIFCCSQEPVSGRSIIEGYAVFRSQSFVQLALASFSTVPPEHESLQRILQTLIGTVRPGYL